MFVWSRLSIYMEVAPLCDMVWPFFGKSCEDLQCVKKMSLHFQHTIRWHAIFISKLIWQNSYCNPYFYYIEYLYSLELYAFESSIN